MYFALNYLVSILLTIFFHLSGKNFYKLFFLSKKANNSSFLKESDSLLVIIGMFWFGNILIFLNFFIPTKNIIYFFLILLLIIERKEIINSIKFNKFSFLSLFFLMHSISNNNPSQDSKMYHFFIQNLILNEKINIGISNFDPLYGLGSIFDYLSSTVWVEDYYGFTQLLNLIVISSFFNFLFIQLKINNKSLIPITLSTVLIGLLDNLGFGGGRNGYIFIQEIGKFDNVYAVIFFMTIIFFYFASKDNNVNSINFSLLILFSTFLIQIRSMGYLMLVFVLIFLIVKDKLYEIRNNFIFIGINLIWIIKNFLTSSCLIYPIQLTCVNLVDWHWPQQSYQLSLRATSNNRNPNEETIELFNFNWFNEYWIDKNISYLLNFALSFIILNILLRIISKNSQKINHKSSLIIKFCLVVYLLSWLVLYPNYRFVSGIFLSIYIIFNMNLILNINYKLISSRLFINISTFFLVISLLLTVRLDSYITFYKNPNINLFAKHQVTNPILFKKEIGYGYDSKEFYCFGALICSKSQQKTTLEKELGYKKFIPLNKDLYN